MEGPQEGLEHFPEEKILAFAGHRVMIAWSSKSYARAGIRSESAWQL